MEALTPFLKWAGGKRWLIRRFPSLIPESFNSYFEPFVGSGAVFFSLLPKRGRISDTNLELIQTYKAIKKDPSAVLRALRRHQRNHCNGYYYEIRAARPRALNEIAARTLYLDRTCWNGLYRVNLKGEFNVPRGTKDSASQVAPAFTRSSLPRSLFT
jgi:DNA adenine methylase